MKNDCVVPKKKYEEQEEIYGKDAFRRNTEDMGIL